MTPRVNIFLRIELSWVKERIGVVKIFPEVSLRNITIRGDPFDSNKGSHQNDRSDHESINEAHVSPESHHVLLKQKL
jgi:hypothetical protein